MALIQITPPDDNGYCSLGVAVDVAREAIERASLVVGEINTAMPFTYGDTFVSIDDFDLLVQSKREPVVYDLPDVTLTIDQVAANVASVIKDGDCLSFSLGPLFDALVPHLARKKDLGIHSLFFTDALAELVKSGAVTNSRKSPFRGKSLVSYALGTKSCIAGCTGTRWWNSKESTGYAIPSSLPTTPSLWPCMKAGKWICWAAWPSRF